MADNAIQLVVSGSYAVVYDSDGKEITRREGFKNPHEFVVKFPVSPKFWNCTVDGGKIISKKIIPNNYPRIELPHFEKSNSISEIVSYKYVPNWHSPASINTKTGLMLYNKYFTTLSFAKRWFIKCHEKGHFYYNTEKYCDLFATKCLLDSGFGLSQSLEVLRNTLQDSPQKTERYDYVLKHLKNGKGAF